MKKYLMTAVAALALGGLMTSCTHDTDIAQTASQDIIQQYEKVFTTAFGTPAPNQTWGFGENTSTTASTRAMTRNIPTKPTFRDTKPAKSLTMPTNYSETLPSTAKFARDYQNYQSGDVIYINNDFNSLNNPQNTSDLTIYADGTNVSYGGQTYQNGNGTVFVVTKNSTLTLTKVENNLTVYLAEGATLKLPNDATFQKSHAAIYLNAKSKVEAAGLTFVESASILNEGGTIEATSLSLNSSTLWNSGTVKVTNALSTINNAASIINDANNKITAGSLTMSNNNDLLYNDGTVDITGAITLEKGTAEIINNDTLTSASLSMTAASRFHNVGTVSMTGKTYVYNTNSKWMNDGEYTCGEFEHDGGTGEPFVFNNCKLIVNGNFHQNHGYFVLDGGNKGGAYVFCESFTWDHDGYFMMGSKSMLEVEGRLLSRNYNSSPAYGFHGEGDEYAVIKAGSIEKETEGKYRAAYYGNLFIDTNNHFEQGQASDGPWYYHDSSVQFSFTDKNDASVVAASTIPVSIPESECSPGYNGGGKKEVDSSIVRIIAEDLTWGSENGDFDFNDVVFDVKLSEDKQTITITLLAAGGTLPLRIAGQYEVHEKFGVPTGTMVNTGTRLSVTKPKQTWSFPNSDSRNYKLEDGKEVAQSYGSTVKEVAYNLPVEVYKLINGTKVWVELQAPVGKAAAKVAVDNLYQWCDERQSIDAKYYDSSRSKGKFSMYVRMEEPYDKPDAWNTWYK